MIKKKGITAGIFMALTIIFTVLVKIVDVKPIGPNGTSVGFATINGKVHELLGTHLSLFTVTNFLGYLALGIVLMFAIAGFIQLLKRKNILKVDKDILELGGLYLVVLGMYFLFEKIIVNYRPIIMPGETEVAASFPSSHTVLAVVVFVSLAIVAKDYCVPKSMAKYVKIVAYILTAVMISFRFLSGIHWFTDIIAGLLYSITLVEIFAFINLALRDKDE